MPVAFGADEVRFDAHAQALEIVGHVHVDEPPFHLTGSALVLRRVPIGAELEGDGTLAFCPCLGTPLAVRFSEATVAVPLIAGYAYHKGAWKNREAKRWGQIVEPATVA